MVSHSTLTTLNFITTIAYNIQHIHHIKPTSRLTYVDVFNTTYNTQHIYPFTYNIIVTGWHTCLPRRSNGIHIGYAYNCQHVYTQHIDITDRIDYQR
jgi:hypothetical protein